MTAIHLLQNEQDDGGASVYLHLQSPDVHSFSGGLEGVRPPALVLQGVTTQNCLDLPYNRRLLLDELG